MKLTRLTEASVIGEVPVVNAGVDRWLLDAKVIKKRSIQIGWNALPRPYWRTTNSYCANLVHFEELNVGSSFSQD